MEIETTTLPAEGGAAAPATEQQPATTTAPDTGQEQTPPNTPETPPKAPPSEDDEHQKAQKRIDRLTREKWEARRQAAAYEARLQELERTQQQRDPNAPLTQADVERLAVQRAGEMRRQEDFNARCNEAYELGSKEIPDFDVSLAGFRSIGGLPPMLVEAALETDAPHKVLAYLGKNLEEAESIIRLSPARMGAAVAKLAVKAAAPPPPKPVTKAPAPITPISTSGRVEAHEIDPNKDIEGWARQRNEHMAQKGRR